MEDIIAIMPEAIPGYGIGSIIYTTEKAKTDKRSPTLILKNIYDELGKKKKLIDRQIKKTTGVRRNFPYVIDHNNVLFPVKYRKSSYDKDTRAFVNVKYVEDIVGSDLILTTGNKILTLNDYKALRTNRLIAMICFQEEIIKILSASFDAYYFAKK